MKLTPGIIAAENRHAEAIAAGRRPVWSISVLEGASLASLAPSPRCRHPALAAADVRDAPAEFVADPFLLSRDGRLHLFFELYHRKRRRGEIARASSADGLRWDYEGSVLRAPHHLSYPFVFEADGEVYLMPESYQARDIALYRAAPFPSRWERAATLVSGRPYVDPTLLSHEGRHYLFAGESFRGDLHLFVAESLRGPWRTHPASPVVRADARHARPAGRFLRDAQGWIRLAQSTEPVYGAFISAFRITRLDADAYAEEPMAPYPLLAGSGSGWNAFGMHHLDALRREDGSWFALADGLGPRA